MKAYSAETSHTTLQKDTFEFIMTDQQTAEPHPHPAQLREAPSDLLADLRAKIDVIDAKLSALIVERLATCRFMRPSAKKHCLKNSLNACRPTSGRLSQRSTNF